MLQRGHDARLLQELVQAHTALALHLLHGHEVRAVGLKRAPLHRRLQHTTVDRAIAALRDLGQEGKLLQGYDEFAQHRVAEDVTNLVPPDAVLPPVSIEQTFQGLPHHEPLHRRDKVELPAQLGVRHLQDVARALQRTLLHPRADLLADAEASDEGRELVLAPEQRRAHGLPVPRVLLRGATTAAIRVLSSRRPAMAVAGAGPSGGCCADLARAVPPGVLYRG
mmetsp:Transcript_45745/g.141399  ORF Transcript_45745/g.141399 Transcript_45745/m.141399 type:complete len:223 (-) Transcript_45745:117-785(-)